MEAIFVAISLPIILFGLYYMRKTGIMFSNTIARTANRLNDIATINLVESQENIERRYTAYKQRQETNNYLSIRQMREEAQQIL